MCGNSHLVYLWCKHVCVHITWMQCLQCFMICIVQYQYGSAKVRHSNSRDWSINMEQLFSFYSEPLVCVYVLCKSTQLTFGGKWLISGIQEKSCLHKICSGLSVIHQDMVGPMVGNGQLCLNMPAIIPGNNGHDFLVHIN